MFRYIIALILFPVILIFLNCASIFTGSLQTMPFSSDPVGAKVYVNGQYMGKTPLQLNLKKNQSYSIEFRKEGFENKTVLVNNTVGAGWIVIDVIFGLIPVIVDAATGNWNSLEPSTVNAALEAQGH